MEERENKGLFADLLNTIWLLTISVRRPESFPFGMMVWERKE